MRLSIIIPVYNVEPYVERCIRSLMEQDIEPGEYEVIVINDGSPDNSRKIVLRLQKEFNNIVFIEQENKGVSVARNEGIAVARGKYILCVDPDDYILPNTLERVVNIAETGNLDVLYLSFTILGVKGQVEYVTDYSKLDREVISGVDTYFKSRGVDVRDPDRSVGILYNTEFIKSNKLLYPVDVPYLEDGLFLAKVLCLANRCAFDNHPFYQRTTRDGSATHSELIYSKLARKGFVNALLEMKQFSRRYNIIAKTQKYLINQVVAKFTLLPLQSCVQQQDRVAYKDMLTVLRDSGIKKLRLEGVMNVYRNLGMIYNLSVGLFFYYYSILLFYRKLVKTICK